ncbi:MAG: rhodanese-like domain-containing protein [Dissulfurispiraceae bacterium]
MEDINAGNKIETLDVDQAKELLGNKGSEFIILDVRQPEEYKSGHLPGAVFIPLPDLINKVGELDRTRPILAYCRSGNRSRAAAAFLLAQGFSKIYSMDGGITAWNGHVATGSYSEKLNDDILNREPLKGVMEGGVRIEDVVSFLQGRDKTLLDILEVSMQLGINALDLYIKILRKIEDVRAKKVFDILIEEEKNHLSKLGKLLGERIN